MVGNGALLPCFSYELETVMRKSKRNKSKTILQILLIILLIIAMFVGIRFTVNNKDDVLTNDENAVGWNGEQSLPKPTIGNLPAIEIPGFNKLVLIANTTKQKVNFYNPKGNDCYFQMNLYVNDEPLWQSGNVPPGSGYYEIELTKPLKEIGTVSGYLEIRCFRRDCTELNSATVKFDTIIIPQGD